MGGYDSRPLLPTLPTTPVLSGSSRPSTPVLSGRDTTSASSTTSVYNGDAVRASTSARGEGGVLFAATSSSVPPLPVDDNDYAEEESDALVEISSVR